MMTTLRDISLLITDGKHGDCQNELGSGYYFVSCKDIKDGWIDYSGARQITRADYIDTHRRTQLEPDDIVITNSGTIGRMALVRGLPETKRTTFQKSVAIIKPNKQKVIPRWLYYSLMANRDVLISWAGGTAQKNLLLRDMRAFNIDVPPFSNQRKIAAILSAYDDLIENNTRRIKILEEMAHAVYREWFVKFRFPGHEKVKMIDSPLGPIPEGWEIIRLGDIAEEIRRGIQKGNLEEPMPYVGLEHIPRKSLALNNWDIAEALGSNKLIFERGEVLFGKIRPYFHKVSVAPFRGICSADTIVIRSISEEYTALVTACVSSENFVAHATATSNGAKMPRANWKVLVEYPVLKPAPDLLDKFSIFFYTVIEEQQNLVRRNHILRQSRDLLLPRLISGELDVSDLNIETSTEAA